MTQKPREVQFYKERSNPQCQNPLMLGERNLLGWQVADHFSKRGRAMAGPQ